MSFVPWYLWRVWLLVTTDTRKTRRLRGICILRATSVHPHRHFVRVRVPCMCVYLYIHTRTHFLRGCGDQNEQSSFLTLTLAQWFSHSLLFSPPIEVCLRLWHHIRLRKVRRIKWFYWKIYLFTSQTHRSLQWNLQIISKSAR